MIRYSKQHLAVSVALCVTAGGAHAQNSPQISATSLENISISAEFSKSKRPKVSTELAQIEGRFRRGGGGPREVIIEAIATTSGAELLLELESLGLEGGASFGNLVSGRLSLGVIASAENLPELRFIRVPTAIRRVGSVDSQADIAMGTASARATFGIDGAGVAIGILSDSYDQLGGEAADIASGDLPSDVVVIDDSALGANIDEGRAMAQLIHDIAPGADLLFHTAFNGEPDFAQGILDLAAAGADIIVDDIGYLNSPMFQDGVVGQAVDQVVANGAVYFSAAGNSADSSYEASYVDSGTSIAGLSLTNIHEFGPGDIVQEIVVPAGGSTLLSVQWDQPFASAGGVGASTDVDVFLIDSTGTAVVAAGVNANIGGDAVELVFWQNTSGASETVGLVVGLFDDLGNGPVPGRLKWIDFNGSKVHTPATNSSTVFSHPNSAGAIAVGAAGYFNTPAFGVSPPVIEPFSSHGGLEVIFDPDGNSIPPEDRNKPEVVAPDGTDNTFFGSDFEPNGFPNFFGTSAAAPHAAALAALQLECDPSLTPANIENQQASTATDMESAGFDNISGTGLLDAPLALAIACPPVDALTCNGLAATVDLNLGQSPTSGPDVIIGTPGNDTINGLGGDDVICGMGGNDFIMGGSGSDIIYGGDDNGVDDGFNDLFGGTGDDFLYGAQFDDYLFGNSGDDYLETNDSSSGFPDQLWGGSGNDEMISNSAFGSLMRGQGNNDIITGSQSADTMRGDPGLDTMFGRNGSDDMSGGNAADTIYGGAGHDIIAGNNNRDTLLGQNGNDTILGGLGNDSMNGGAGTDSCNGQGQTGGAGDTATDCETTTGVPFGGVVAGISGNFSRRSLTEREIDLIDLCDLSIDECLARKRR